MIYGKRTVSGPLPQESSIILSPATIVSTGDIYTVDLGLHQNIDNAITAGGYVSPDKRIDSRSFRYDVPRAPSKARLELVEFDRPISCEEAKLQLKQHGFCSAGIWELLALGEQYPDVQRQFSVVALDSCCYWRGDGHWRVPYLCEISHCRSLRLYVLFSFHFGHELTSPHRFLVVRK